jgi:DNA ligase D-like protein (predicted 3'-phosphoesterase)
MGKKRARDTLGPYRSKRDFRKTREPSGRGTDRGPKLKKRDNPFFVVQQHDASSEHYDFRLEVDDVLKSWAVPKGPSTDPSEKRLAVSTEDHPVDYADFEGVIPEDEYGGGTVVVWDAGPYKNLTRDDEDREVPLAQALDEGKAEVWLEGKKIRGGYALVHSRMRGDEKNWLLVKMKDDEADARRKPVRTEPESVLSGRTLEEVAEGGGDEEDE